MLYIGLNRSYEYNIENMGEYDITDKFGMFVIEKIDMKFLMCINSCKV